MGRIDDAIGTLHAMQHGAGPESLPLCASGTRANMLVTLVYLCLLLSVPLQHIQRLLWFAAYPIVWASVIGIGYGTVLRRSLYVLPLIVFVGIFNPIADRVPAFTVGDVTVSRGWVSFLSIVLRGLLSVQAVLVLISACGFADLCRQLRAVGLPAFLTTQLMLMYRYLSVLLEELQTMTRARAARCYGRKNMPLPMWAAMAGQLFLRSVDRAQRIHQAMMARGFNGSMPSYAPAGRHASHGPWPNVCAAAWIALFAVLRWAPLIDFTHMTRL